MSQTKREASREDRVEIQFLEGVLRRAPENISVLEALGNLCTKAGRIEDGLAVDLKLTALQPDNPHVWYNRACSESLSEKFDDALASLRRAFSLGYNDIPWLLRDDDLEPLRDDPRLQKILAEITAAPSS